MLIFCFTSGCFVQYLPGAVLCCVLFGVGMGGVAAFMNVIFAESLGIEIIQVTTCFRVVAWLKHIWV